MSQFQDATNIIIVGAGVAGLTTSMWLKREHPEKQVTVFDKRDFSASLWDPKKGGDTASADLNKVMRASYGHEIEYQRLAYEGRDIWKYWNAQIQQRSPAQLPNGMLNQDKVYVECGFYRFPGHEGRGLASREVQGLLGLEKESPEWRSMAYLRREPEDVKRAKEAGWDAHMSTFKTFKGPGVLDTTAGFTVAHKACNFASQLAKEAGVQFVFGQAGDVTGFLRSGKKVCGVQTADGKCHRADVVIVCAGPWTPDLVPETSRTIEATAGSVVAIQLPVTNKELMDKYSPERFPVYAFGLDNEHTVTESIYGFPRTEDGVMKIGFRGVKWTNFPEGKKISTPITASTVPAQTALPSTAVRVLQRFVQTHFPDLIDMPRKTRLCWYNDSNDNNFMIDYVPNTGDGLFVCCGGSGHMFKFLPVLGKYVVKALKKEKTQFTPLWRFRTPPAGYRANGLEDGPVGFRAFEHLKFIEADKWQWNEAKL